MTRSLFYSLLLTLCISLNVACMDKKQTFDQTQIDYNETVSESEVQRLGQYLVHSQFTDGTPKNVMIKKKDNTYSFKMVIKDDLELTPKLIKTFEIFAFNLSHEVFNRAPVEIKLCNAFFIPTKTIKMANLGKKKVFNGTHVLYNNSVSEKEVDQLGAFLIKSQFTDGSKKDVVLDRKGDTYRFKLVFNKTLKLTDHWISTFESFANQISSEVFNHQPVDVHLLDDLYQSIKVLPFNPAHTQPKTIDPRSLGQKKIFNGTYLYHTPQVSEKLAETLGHYLNTSGFTDGNRKDVQIDYKDQTYLFRMVFNTKVPFNEDLKKQFIGFASRLSSSIFMNKPVDVHLTDIFFKTLHVIPSKPHQDQHK